MGTHNFKIVLLGEGCVGKTSLVVRYVNNQFNEAHITTIQASFLTKRLQLSGSTVNLAIWDTAGQERFHALGPLYYRDANAALLVYDVTDQDSFQKVKNWVKELRKVLGKDIVLFIAGNKDDLPGKAIPLDDAEAYALSVGATHCRTSAKNNVGVEPMFLELAKRMMESAAAHQQAAVQQPGSGGLLLTDDDTSAGASVASKPESGGCC